MVVEELKLDQLNIDNMLFVDAPDSSTDEDDRPLIELKRSTETQPKDTLKSMAKVELPFVDSDGSNDGNESDPIFDANVDTNGSDDQIFVGELEPVPKKQTRRKKQKKPTKGEAQERELEPVPKKLERRKIEKMPTKEEALVELK